MVDREIEDDFDCLYAKIYNLEEEINTLKRILCMYTSIMPIPINSVTDPCTHQGVPTKCMLCQKEITEGDYVNYYVGGNRDVVINHEKKLSAGAVHADCLSKFIEVMDKYVDERCIIPVFIRDKKIPYE